MRALPENRQRGLEYQRHDILWYACLRVKAFTPCGPSTMDWRSGCAQRPPAGAAHRGRARGEEAPVYRWRGRAKISSVDPCSTILLSNITITRSVKWRDPNGLASGVPVQVSYVGSPSRWCNSCTRCASASPTMHSDALMNSKSGSTSVSLELSRRIDASRLSSRATRSLCSSR